MPELKSNIGFLRARACKIFYEFGEIDFKNRNNVTNAVTVTILNKSIIRVSIIVFSILNFL